MINLLPSEAKAEVSAARTNVTLVKYIVVLLLGVIFLFFISTVVYFVLMNTQASAEKIVTDNTSKSTAYSSVQAQGDSLKSSLAIAKTILDKEVAYTKVITGIAKVMPTGVILDSISLSPTTLGTPITLQAYAKTTVDALALKDNFQKSSLFSNVTFVSLANSSSSQAGEYPIAISLSLIINKTTAL